MLPLILSLGGAPCEEETEKEMEETDDGIDDETEEETDEEMPDLNISRESRKRARISGKYHFHCIPLNGNIKY